MMAKQLKLSLRSTRGVNTGLGFLAILLWSTTVAVSRSLTEQLGILTTAALIYGASGSVGCGYLVVTSKLRAPSASLLARLDRRYLWGCGALFVGYMVCLYGGLGLAAGHRQVLIVGLLNYLWPVLTVLLSIPLLRMRATGWVIPGALLALLGIVLALLPPSTSTMMAEPAQGARLLNVPYLLGGCAACCWGLYSTLSRRWAAATGGSAVPVFMLVTGLLLGAARCCIPEATTFTTRAVLELVFQAGASGVAYVFWERAMREGDLLLVATASYFTPLLSTLISSVYLGVVPGARLWWGCGLVIAGAVTCKAAVAAPADAPPHDTAYR
ncbi:MAG: aromatic amino acid DMT transporter YddG [Anaerolineae bacterium]|nr:aromatic amino acid DMT transporter YddG [Anaerolineae bacterium]